jgi:Ca-activated chloride channel family protein
MKRTLGFGAVCALLISVGACGGSSTTEQADPGVVSLAGTLGNTFVPAGENGEMLARVRISTRSIDGSGRPPINLALVIDTSGSMAGEPIEDAREAALAIVGLMREGDRLSVIAFHSSTEVLLPSTVIDDNLDEVREDIGRMQAEGTTDMAGGLQAGLTELMTHFEPEGVNRLVLLGDGVPNDESGIVAMAQAAGERGMSVTAIGLGLDYNETLMGDVAQVSGGQFHYVEESEQVATLFRDEVLRMQRVYGRNAIVRLQPGPGVTIQSVVGQNVHNLGPFVEVHLGDLHEGEHRDLMVRATVEGRRAGATVELMDVHLGFDDAVREAGRLERRVFLGAKSTDDSEELASGRNADIEREAARMQAAAVTVQAIRMTRDGELDAARAMLQRAEDDARNFADGDSAGDADFAAQIETMSAYRQSLGASPASTAAGSGAMGTDGAATGTIEPEAAEEPMPAVDRARIQREVHSESLDALGY